MEEPVRILNTLNQDSGVVFQIDKKGLTMWEQYINKIDENALYRQ